MSEEFTEDQANQIKAEHPEIEPEDAEVLSPTIEVPYEEEEEK